MSTEYTLETRDGRTTFYAMSDEAAHKLAQAGALETGVATVYRGDVKVAAYERIIGAPIRVQEKA